MELLDTVKARKLAYYGHTMTVTDALAILHWLRLAERVNFKLALMAYRVLNGMAPSYLNLLVPVSKHRQLKTFLFHQSFPDIILEFSVLRIRGFRNSFGCFSHVKNIDLHYITLH